MYLLFFCLWSLVRNEELSNLWCFILLRLKDLLVWLSHYFAFLLCGQQLLIFESPLPLSKHTFNKLMCSVSFLHSSGTVGSFFFCVVCSILHSNQWFNSFLQVFYLLVANEMPIDIGYIVVNPLLNKPVKCSKSKVIAHTVKAKVMMTVRPALDQTWSSCPGPWVTGDGMMMAPNHSSSILTCQLMRLDRFSTISRWSVLVGGPYL